MAGYNSDDEDQHMPYHGGGMAPGPFNNPLFANFPGMMMGNMMGHGPQPAPPSAFRRPYVAHSSVLHELTFGKGNQGAHITDGGRTQVMFGGQVMLPQSALRHLTELEIEGPWTFEIINSVQRRLKTHGGVLEFHSQEGTVFLPSWMMRRLELNEGDPVQLFGTRLPKGKFVKLQAQSVLFLELSDPKAVLEQALRSYSVLTQGDIIEISHNMMTFELLVMEIKPEGAGISILNTDLEVDFAAPVGYVEPERKPAAPAPTMKSKMQINTQQTQDVDAAGRGSGASTPAQGGAPAANGNQGGTAAGTSAAAANSFEAFKGVGNTMGGKRIRGKGISVKKAEPVSENSKIFRTDAVRIVTSDTQIGTRKVPAALNLPEGVLFFGFDIKPPPADSAQTDQLKQNAGGVKPPAFTGAGSGVTLSGRTPRPQAGAPSAKVSSSKRPPDNSDDVIKIDSD